MQIINLSKIKDFYLLEASSNAMTILNFMNFSFAGMDLSYIKIKNAYLDLGNFDSTNFQFAKLEKCVLSRTILNRCDFQNAELKDVDFGIPCPDLIGHKSCVNSVAISSDNKYIVSGSHDKTIKIWSLKTGLLINTLAGHSSSVNSVVISSDNKLLVSGSSDKTIKIWNVESG